MPASAAPKWPNRQIVKSSSPSFTPEFPVTAQFVAAKGDNLVETRRKPACYVGTPIAHRCHDVVIELVSSLTPDDEKACATALLQHLVTVLQALPIAYAIRIETADQVLHHSAPLLALPAPVGCTSPGPFWASPIAADAKPI